MVIEKVRSVFCVIIKSNCETIGIFDTQEDAEKWIEWYNPQYEVIIEKCGILKTI